MIPDPFISTREGPDALRPGYFLIQRRRQNRVALPVRIWFGPPVDPDTGEIQDRSWRWQVAIAGQIIDGDSIRVGATEFTALSDFWPGCSDTEINKSEYDFRLARAAWAGENDPNDPFGDPAMRIDPMTTSLPAL